MTWPASRVDARRYAGAAPRRRLRPCRAERRRRSRRQLGASRWSPSSACAPGSGRPFSILALCVAERACKGQVTRSRWNTMAFVAVVASTIDVDVVQRHTCAAHTTAPWHALQGQRTLSYRSCGVGPRSSPPLLTRLVDLQAVLSPPARCASSCAGGRGGLRCSWASPVWFAAHSQQQWLRPQVGVARTRNRDQNETPWASGTGGRSRVTQPRTGSGTTPSTRPARLLHAVLDGAGGHHRDGRPKVLGEQTAQGESSPIAGA